MPLPTPEFPPPQIPKASPFPLHMPSDSAYMSSGDILLTNERIEKSIPYISLNSWRRKKKKGRVSSWFLKETGQGWERAKVRSGEAGLGPCASGDARSPGCAGPCRHLLLVDPRLLLAVPLAVMQTYSIPVKQVQVVDCHLRGTEREPCSRTARPPWVPGFRPRTFQTGGFPLSQAHRNCSKCLSLDTSGFRGAPPTRPFHGSGALTPSKHHAQPVCGPRDCACAPGSPAPEAVKAAASAGPRW